MLNGATGRDGEAARVLKDTYKGVLERLVTLIENGDGRELPAVVRHLHGGRTLTWQISGARCAFCEACGCDRTRYEPEGEGLAFEFCPACWSMRGTDCERQMSFAVGKVVEKRLRDLLPGTKMELRVGGGRLPLNPNDLPGGPGEALDAYRAAARRPLEIGRQFELGRMAFAGTREAPSDYAEARLWLGRALILGEGVERDESAGLALVREAAEAGDADARAWLGSLADG